MVGSMLLFSLFTYLCGAADSLETLVLWRILQGATGAPVTPLSQTILFDVFPRRQHGPCHDQGQQQNGRPEPTAVTRLEKARHTSFS